MKRPALAIAAAVALALLAGIGVFAYTSQAQARAVAEASKATTVLVSAGPIGTGTTFADALADGLLEERQVPESLSPAGVLDPGAAVPEHVAIAPLPADRIVMAGDFATEVPVAGPLAVPDGLIGMSLQLSDPARVGTFLRPGSSIAVYATIEIDAGAASADADAGAMAGGSDRIAMTNLVVDRVTVLGVGQATQRQGDTAPEPQEESQSPTALVTVAVTQEQATRLVHAVQTGALYLGLLAEGTELTTAPGVTDADVFLAP